MGGLPCLKTILWVWMRGSISCSNYVHIVVFPGAVSNDISLRIRGILETFRFDGVNNEVILSIGINSCKSVNKNIKEDIDVFSKNIIDIISQVKISGCNITVLGIMEVSDDCQCKPGVVFDNDIIDLYDEILCDICLNNSVGYVRMRDLLEYDDYIDGLHPNHQGHLKIFKKIKKEILANERQRLLWKYLV